MARHGYTRTTNRQGTGAPHPAEHLESSGVSAPRAAVGPGCASPLSVSAPVPVPTPREQLAQRREDLCRQAGLRFAPVVGETTGGWGPKSMAFLGKLFRAYRARHPGDSEATLASLWGRLSVGLMKAVGWQLARAVVLVNMDGE